MANNLISAVSFGFKLNSNLEKYVRPMVDIIEKCDLTSAS